LLQSLAVEVTTMTDTDRAIEGTAGTDLRSLALASLNKKRDFRAHLTSYLVVNAVIIAIWAMTGANFFWPIFPILGWGIGLFFHGWDVYRAPIDETDIEREMRRLR
jgi:hypothetical protein